MAPISTALAKSSHSATISKLDTSQSLRASTALLRKIQADDATQKQSAKANLLEDADDNDNPQHETPVWMILTTKKHIVDKKRLKPSKISLPHPYLSAEQDGLRICLITADPQRNFKGLIAQASFPLNLAGKMKRVIGMDKLKAKYKSYESRRQLLSEYDVFLADDRIITYLPQLLGKVFYKGGNKRPIPVSLQGKRQNIDEQGNKRRKLTEGGSKVVKSEPRADDVAKEIEKTIGSALVHLAPSTTTAVKVGTASQKPEQLQENIDAVLKSMLEKHVPQQWRNLRAVHIKGPNTAALPIWLAEELWEDENDVLDQESKAPEHKKRKRGALTEDDAVTDVIEVPGPDGEIRRLEKPTSKPKSLDSQPVKLAISEKKYKNESTAEINSKLSEKAERTARKKALTDQKEIARADKKRGKNATPKS